MSLDIDLITNKCEHCGRYDVAYSANTTHNLADMAKEADIYECLWHPERCSVTKAGQLISPLTKAVLAMKKDPDRFKAHNSPNGWGMYRNFLPWLENLLGACHNHPDAEIEVSV